jgi:hypothetical protein
MVIKSIQYVRRAQFGIKSDSAQVNGPMNNVADALKRPITVSQRKLSKVSRATRIPNWKYPAHFGVGFTIRML